MSWDSRSYCVKLLNRASKELNIDFWVDYICFDPRPICPLSQVASWEFTGKDGSVVYIPKNLGRENKDILSSLVFHEAAHSFLFHHPRAVTFKYLTSVFGEFVEDSYLVYRMKAIWHYFSEREEGYCSGYALTSPEEDFAETFSFVLLNRKRKGDWFFDGELVDYKNDPVLLKKVKAIKRLLRL